MEAYSAGIESGTPLSGAVRQHDGRGPGWQDRGYRADFAVPGRKRRGPTMSRGSHNDAEIVVVGPGNLGTAVVEQLARQPALGTTVVVGRRRQRALERANLAKLAAAAAGVPARLEVEGADLERHGELAELVRRRQPAVVLLAASLAPWWWLERLPPAPRGRLQRAGFGAWLPVHLTLALRCMAELEEAGYRGVSLMAPYPDVVCPVLAAVGRPPTCGVGNVDEVATKLRTLVAARLQMRLDAVSVRLVAHHALQAFVFGREEAGGPLPPYLLRVEVEGRDGAGGCDPDALLRAACPLPPGPAWNRFTAASAANLVRALLAPGPEVLHAPGPDGLPGGYPVTVGGGRIALHLDGFDRDEAVRVNQASHRFDGIEAIDEDGGVVFTDETRQVMNDELGYDCGRLRVAECRQRAVELLARLRGHAARYGIELHGDG